MKKLVLSLIIVMLASTAFAQFSGGLKLGVNLATMKFKSDDLGVDDSESGTSFHIGAYGNFGLSDAISLQPELLYNSIDIDGDKLNYISIPVMLVYGFSENKFNVQIGPQIGLLMSTDPSELKDDDFIAGTDFTLNIGAGANFGKFNATARYGIGLGNVAGSVLTDNTDAKMTLNNIQISIGYKLFGE